MRIHDKRFFESLHSFLENYLPKIKRRDSDTIKAYKEALNQYLNFICSSYKISLMEVTIDHFTGENIVSFIDSLSEKGYAISTINHRLSLLRSFCKYAMRNNLLKIIELEKITEIKEVSNTQAKSLVYLSIDEMAAVLRLPDVNTKFGSRDRFYMALLYDSAARDSEILLARTENFKVNSDNTAELHIIGKGTKYRAVPISSDVVRSYNQYLKYWDKKEYLFYTERKGVIAPMSDDNAARILNKYEKLVKKELPELPHLHPHLFRHTRAMHLLEAGVPLALIGEWLGHTDLETTKIYATATISMKREASMKVTSAHPTIFPNNNQFMYLDDEEKMRKLYGLK